MTAAWLPGKTMEAIRPGQRRKAGITKSNGMDRQIAVLDSGRYAISEQNMIDGAATLAMVSPPDTRTGVQITRKITLHPGSTRIVLDLSFTQY